MTSGLPETVRRQLRTVNRFARWILLGCVLTALAAIALTVYVIGLAWHGAQPAIRGPSKAIAPLIDAGQSPLHLAAGYSLNVYAEGIADARVIIADPNGVPLVSSPQTGTVYALPDKNASGRSDETRVVIDGLDAPHGLAMLCQSGSCTLFVAQAGEVTAFDYDSVALRASNARHLADLPTGGRHVTRSLLLAPNGKYLLVSIGSSCDACRESDSRRGTIMSLPLVGGSLQPYATGLRNSVFMTIRPGTNEVWATEMGHDNLGDDLPPDEINVIESGKNYGWPICYGDNVHDTVIDKNVYVRNPCQLPQEVPARIDILAHSAPLGLAFADGAGWGTEAGSLFVAYHGSWNRTTPTGYKVVKFKVAADGNTQGMEDVVTGWLQLDDTSLGRPTGLLARPDGSLLIADDTAGVIYRLYRNSP